VRLCGGEGKGADHVGRLLGIADDEELGIKVMEEIFNAVELA